MSSYEAFQHDMFQEAEGKLIAELSMSSGLISNGIGTYIENPWMEQILREHIFSDEDDLMDIVHEILSQYNAMI